MALKAAKFSYQHLSDAVPKRLIAWRSHSKRISGRRLSMERLESRELLASGLVMTQVTNISDTRDGFLTSDGKIVLAGGSQDGMLALATMAAIPAPGALALSTLDESFGQGELSGTMFSENPRVCANAAAVDPSTGKIVLAGRLPSTFRRSKTLCLI